MLNRSEERNTRQDPRQDFELTLLAVDRHELDRK